ncbi:hypothetical protein DES53_102784 [Roseimicrobium gellanilyticum]|uniref:Uncharacterized protein n=1 Tax=Roseimicrobium gellanilyticum TaxID=748857 RepID=A0A366HTY7_9BACT|nr:hypothetical protein [Roseimicrobium gellanilyticum]RBP46393.1 hypothetical protein DES53_102784 [Roseimicrobium gellanilyticum]
MSDRKAHHGNFPGTTAVLVGRREVLELGLKDPALTPWQKAFLEDEVWEVSMLLSMLRHPEQRTYIEVPADF